MILTLNVIPRRAGNELEIIVLASAMMSNFFTGSTLDRREPPDVCDSVYEGGTLILGLAATSLNCAAIENLLGGPKSQDWWKHIPNLLELRDARSTEKIIVGKRLDLYGFPHRDAPAVTEKS